MAQTISDLILENVKSALQNISITNGYNQDIGLVNDDNLKNPDELSDDEFPALFLVDGDESKEPADIDSTGSELKFIVIGYLKQSDYDEDLQQVRRTLEGDVEKAIMVDPRRGMMAIDTEPVTVIRDKGVFPDFAIFEFTFKIKYYHNRKNPFSQNNSPT